MTDKQQPEALLPPDIFGCDPAVVQVDAATTQHLVQALRIQRAEIETLTLYKNLADEYGLSIFKDLKDLTTEIENLRAKLKTHEDLGDAGSDVQLLRMGYAAARLEIESLKAQLAGRAKEQADELAVAPTTQPATWDEGVQAVAAMLAKKADDFALEHGHDDMGGLSFGSGAHAEAKMDWHSGLLELEEEARAMLGRVFPMTGDEEESDLGDWQDGTAKPTQDGTYLREFDEGPGTSEFHQGKWLRDGFFPSDIQDARWRGRAAPTTQPAPQQEAQEPVGYTHASWIAEAKRGGGGSFVGRKNAAFDVPIYTAPPHSPAAQGDALDAARYRFLRDGEWRDTGLEPFIRLQLNTLWDAKIDAARAAQEGKSHDN